MEQTDYPERSRYPARPPPDLGAQKDLARGERDFAKTDMPWGPAAPKQDVASSGTAIALCERQDPAPEPRSPSSRFI
jgi:hypothetical protein